MNPCSGYLNCWQLQAGAWVWKAGSSSYYMASKSPDTGQITSKILHKKRFDSLVSAGVLIPNPDNEKQWVLADHLKPQAPEA